MKSKVLESEAFKIISLLENQPEIIDFLKPVNYKKQGLNYYRNIISQPMSLFTIKSKLFEGVYNSFTEFLEDLNLIWSNCRVFNESRSLIVKNANKLERLINTYLKKSQRLLQKSKTTNSSFKEHLGNNILIVNYVTLDEIKGLKEKIINANIDTQSKIIDLVKKYCSRAIAEDGERLVLSLERLKYQTFHNIKLLINSGSDTSF